MAHDNNGRIYIGTTGVEIADVQAVLGLTENDIGGLITQGASQGRINKWAKCKPIRYYTYDTINQRKVPYPGLLTGDMWKGAVLEQTDNGIFYGIKVRMPGIDQQMNTWPLLHGTTFDYCPPRGLSESEFFRLRDFEEYRTSAVPNPFASFGNEGSATGFYNNANGITGIAVRYYETNQWGVDLSGVLMGPSDDRQAVLSRTYPCIIIGKDNTHYITALGYEDDQNHAPRPLYYNNAYLGGTWVADTSKHVFSISGHETTAPWTSPQTGLSATIVLLRSAKSGGIYLDAMGSQDLAQNWFECTTDITTNYTPVPMPGACGVEMSLVAYENAFKVMPISVVSCDTATVTVSFQKTYAGTASSPMGSAVISAHVGHNGVYGGDWKDVTMFLRGSETTTSNVTFNATDFDMQMFMPHETYSIEINTTASPGETGYGELTFTIP